jgi:hypothetical protein
MKWEQTLSQLKTGGGGAENMYLPFGIGTIANERTEVGKIYFVWKTYHK